MFSKKIFTLLLTIFTAISAVTAQGLSDVRINEIMVNNTDSYIDDYGHREGWIELKNTGYSKVNVAGCKLAATIDGKEVVYRIPTHDPNRTSIIPRGYIVLFADGSGLKGPLYTNFTLNNCSKVTLYQQDGKTVISAIDIDKTASQENISFGYSLIVDSDEYELKVQPAPTPATCNDGEVLFSRADQFQQQDPIGITMAITAMSVVFAALLILFLVFQRLGIIVVNFSAKKDKKNSAAAPKGKISGEVVAAIAVAIKQFEDEKKRSEASVITINRAARAYSPWSSKIFGVNNTPVR